MSLVASKRQRVITKCCMKGNTSPTHRLSQLYKLHNILGQGLSNEDVWIAPGYSVNGKKSTDWIIIFSLIKPRETKGAPNYVKSKSFTSCSNAGWVKEE